MLRARMQPFQTASVLVTGALFLARRAGGAAGARACNALRLEPGRLVCLRLRPADRASPPPFGFAPLCQVGTPLAIPTKGGMELGRIASMELNHKPVDTVRSARAWGALIWRRAAVQS